MHPALGKTSESRFLCWFPKDHFLAATRQFNEARARARLQSLLEERLEPDALARLLAEGARMNEEEAGRLALQE